MSVRDFLKGQRTRAFGPGFSQRVGLARRPGLKAALRVVREERAAFERSVAFGRQTVAERLVSAELLPETWLTPDPSREFDAQQALTRLHVVDLVTLASLGAEPLQRAELLFLEVCARSPQLRWPERVAPVVHWGCLPANESAPSALSMWVRDHDEWREHRAARLDPYSARDQGLIDAVGAELSALEGCPSADALRALRDRAVRLSDLKPDLLRRTLAVPGPLRGQTGSGPTFIERRLWALSFLHEMSKIPALTPRPIPPPDGPTREALLGYYQALGSLYELGLLPGEIDGEGGDLCVLTPDARWALELRDLEDEPTGQG